MPTSHRLIDTPTAADFFCGGGGASEGVLAAGVELRFAANHDAVAIATHAHRHPGVDHYQVDLVDYDVARMPRVQMAHFSPSCVHHSQANATKVYEQPATLLDHLHGDTALEPEARSGYASSERSRVTMSCVIRYADAHRPELMIVENVVEAAKWGPNRNGDTFRWWLGELDKLGYRTRPLMLNSAAFGVPQMRDRMFVVCWRNTMRTPDLAHHVPAWCPDCDRTVDARQVFRRRTKAWPVAEWGKLGQQYDYRCNVCHQVAYIAYTPASTVIDWGDLGIRIGDRDRPLAQRTLERIQRGIDAHDGRLPLIYDYQHTAHPAGWPMSTLTTAETHGLLADGLAGLQVVAAGNTFERAGSTCRTRSLNEPTWTQHTTASIGIATHTGAVIPFRQHTRPTRLDEPVCTQTAQQVPGLALWNPAGMPDGAMFAKNYGTADDTAYHPTSDAFNTITTRDNTSLASIDQHPTSGRIELDDVRFRMLNVDEIRRTMAYPDDWRAIGPDPDRAPTKRDQIRLLGDGVTPPVLTWCTNRALTAAA